MHKTGEEALGLILLLLVSKQQVRWSNNDFYELVSDVAAPGAFFPMCVDWLTEYHIKKTHPATRTALTGLGNFAPEVWWVGQSTKMSPCQRSHAMRFMSSYMRQA